MNKVFSALIVAALFVGSTALAGKGHMHQSMEEKWKMMDTNKDGKLSAQEHADSAKQMFAKMDKDSDGFVTEAEHKAKMEEMKMQK